MKILNKHFLFCCLVASTLFAPFSLSGQKNDVPDLVLNQAIIPDGIYLIGRSGDVAEDLIPLASKEALISFSELFREKTDPGVIYLVVRTDAFVPLRLAKAPETENQEDNRKRLMLKLTDDASLQLAEFTKEYLDQHTAIVVDGQALTMHKIRSVIEGGKMQITRCTDNACEFLYEQLSDNVVETQ